MLVRGQHDCGGKLLGSRKVPPRHAASEAASSGTMPCQAGATRLLDADDELAAGDQAENPCFEVGAAARGATPRTVRVSSGLGNQHRHQPALPPSWRERAVNFSDADAEWSPASASPAARVRAGEVLVFARFAPAARQPHPVPAQRRPSKRKRRRTSVSSPRGLTAPASVSAARSAAPGCLAAGSRHRLADEEAEQLSLPER